MAAPAGNDAAIPIPPDPLASSTDIMGSVKNRARVFTEAFMIMVCPVLLAILRGSAQSKLASAVAGAALFAGIGQFLVICPWKVVKNWACATSKILVHSCVVLLIGLACVIMNLIGLKSVPGYVTTLVMVGGSSFGMFCMSWRQVDGQATMSIAAFEEFKGSLDASAYFSAAVTAVLFLGLEALALEGLIKGDLKHLLAFPLGWSFVTCTLGIFSMLLVSVHPLIYGNPAMTSILRGSSFVLAVCVCVVVYYFTGAAVGEIKAIGWLSPSVVPSVVWLYLAIIPCITGNPTIPEEEHEPASLELIKITFAVFLAVSVINIDTSIGDCTWIIFPTALAIITGVQWRLMTHWKNVSGAVARAADVACVMSHLFMAVAVIPFALLAATGVTNQEANSIATAPMPSN
ncbi:uncharacterized protein LOC123405359 [Hordeum vulgare subsp. vulgare]|uniref:Predicted protein n=1 Tax=Hordeum vulgare subsp. vulgare TaxID=112509 RepID=F2DXT0_HORVV|nr:uncharacterized protein LOC123405349 [Hordeum vulgare subsp. vulgare]XP_044955013.1 uncharacterized protein LOC123405359 [Hordeum vulgare subsp. vulgare]BAJ99901.1 predicted protein [Hordeum vulgare subsp. vulgare]